MTPSGRPLASDWTGIFISTGLRERCERETGVPPCPPDMSSSEQSDCILIADDHPANLLALEAVLEPLGHPIIKLSSGVEALRFLLDHDCSLALLDVAMPGLDGFDTAALIRSRERTRHIPIIFISASARDETHVFKGYAQGAIDYVVKPFDPDVLRAKVTNLLALHRRGEEMRREAALRGRERDELREKEQQARAEAEAQRKRLQTLLMQAPSVIAISKGPDHVFELVNERCQQLLGSRQVLGKPAREALRDLLPQDAWKSADHVYESGKAFVGTEAAISLDEHGREGSERRFFNFVVQPTRDQSGNIDGLMLHAFEVTDQVRARERERDAIRLRDEFLSIASHELRTPLTPLRLQLQSTLKCLDKGECAEAELRPRLELALRQTVRLGTLVSDLLEVSRITSGRLTLQREEMDLAESVRDVAERHEPEARNTGTTVQVQAERVVGRWDRLRIEQVIANLLVNAIKYGGGQPVRLTVERADGAAKLTVRDEGIGISNEDQERIFDRFERAVSARSYGGMGLGLYIAQQIVDAHGGRIQVRSARGQGSTFTVDLPI
jgi:signal transduction histidine kinase